MKGGCTVLIDLIYVEKQDDTSGSVNMDELGLTGRQIVPLNNARKRNKPPVRYEIIKDTLEARVDRTAS